MRHGPNCVQTALCVSIGNPHQHMPACTLNSCHCPCSCGCLFDGFAGELCDEITETMCPNQCSGHGECITGFCKCHAGWYGTDCARKVAGEPMEPGTCGLKGGFSLGLGVAVGLK